MGRRRLSVLLLLLAAAAAHSQEASPLRALDSISSIQTLSRSTFAGKGLYGYINGGAELYHEYGFDRLEVRTVRAGRSTWTVEGYAMRDSFAAFGILTVSRGGCAADTVSGPCTFTSAYQLQGTRGSLFIRIADPRGDRLDTAIARQILRIVEGGTDLGDVTPAGLFGGSFPPGDPAEIIAVRGPLGLQNGRDEYSELFDGIERYDLAILPAEEGNARVSLLSLLLRNADDREIILSRWKNCPKGTARASRSKGDRLLLLETSGSGPLIEMWRDWFSS